MKHVFSILAALLVAWLSLSNSNNFNGVNIEIPFADKIVHIGMYFFLMLVIALEHRATLIGNTALLKVSLIPVAYGILMELLQLLTTTRSGDSFDALADIVGVLIAILAWMFLRRYIKW